MFFAKSLVEYFKHHSNYKSELEVLRNLLLECGLEEILKWGAPVYTYQKKNLIGIGAFKSYVGLWFYQGSFLKDPAKVLYNAHEGVTKGLRQWRFSEGETLPVDLIKSYILEAIENHKQGKEIKPEEKVLEIPELLQNELDSNNELMDKFKILTHYKQKEFADYISSAKRDATKQSRLVKCIPLILEGVGLNDKYRK